MKSLFPQSLIVDMISDRKGFDACPYCGESRITDCLYGFVTFVCGSSGNFLKQTTKCEKERWLPFVESYYKDSSC